MAVNECATQIIPCLILVFEGLKRAYQGTLYTLLIYVLDIVRLKSGYALILFINNSHEAYCLIVLTYLMEKLLLI